MNEDALRLHLVELLDGGKAHIRFDEAVRDWPVDLRGRKPEGAAHTPWETLEHLRICQRDILLFSKGPHVSPEWPEGYWPATEQPPSEGAWNEAVESFRADLAEMTALVEDAESDLFTPFEWGDGQTLLREAMLTADHNAYQLGELMALRNMLGA